MVIFLFVDLPLYGKYVIKIDIEIHRKSEKERDRYNRYQPNLIVSKDMSIIFIRMHTMLTYQRFLHCERVT